MQFKSERSCSSTGICTASSNFKISAHGIITALITLFIMSMIIVHFIGLLSLSSNSDFKKIEMDGMETEQEYVYILDLQEGYLCMPADYETISKNGSDYKVITIHTKEYKIISKDTCVTIKDNPVDNCIIDPQPESYSVSSHARMYNLAMIFFTIIIGTAAAVFFKGFDIPES